MSGGTTTALDVCFAARRAWENSQPQTFFDLAALDEEDSSPEAPLTSPRLEQSSSSNADAFTPSAAGTETMSAPGPGLTASHAGEGRPAAAPPHDNGPGDAHSDGARDSGAPGDHHA